METTEKVITHKEKIDWMINYAFRNKVFLELEGECGFGRKCVGITTEDHYPDYYWHDKETWDRLDSNGDVWIPKDAYHKHACVAVLGRGEEAESQLFEWLKWFDTNGFVIEKGDNDISKEDQLSKMISLAMGSHRYARMVKKN